jgi:hypothetical protein
VPPPWGLAASGGHRKPISRDLQRFSDFSVVLLGASALRNLWIV